MHWKLLLSCCTLFLASHLFVVTNGMECYTCLSTTPLAGYKTVGGGDDDSAGGDGGGGTGVAEDTTVPTVTDAPTPAPNPIRRKRAAEESAEGDKSGGTTGTCPDLKKDKWSKVKNQFIEECDVGVTACQKLEGKTMIGEFGVTALQYGCISDEEIEESKLERGKCVERAKKGKKEDGSEGVLKRKVCVCDDVINCNKSSKTLNPWIGLLVVATFFSMLVRDVICPG